MESTKTTNNIRNQALAMRQAMVDLLKANLSGYGNLVDQLRVMGYLGQAMVDMANSELAAIKALDEEEKRTAVKVYQ